MIKLFRKPPGNLNRIVVNIVSGGISTANITRRTGSLPIVEAVRFTPGTKSSGAVLMANLGREMSKESYQCSTLLNPGDYQLLTVEAPKVGAAEMKKAIRWRLKDIIDFHIDEAVIDLVDIPTGPGGENRVQLMLAVVAHNQAIELCHVQFSQAKLRLTTIDIPEMAQRNFSALLEPEDRGLALLSFDHNGGLLTVTFRGDLYLSRRIDVTIDQLEQFDLESKAVCYEQISLELQRSLDHCDRQFHFIPIAKLTMAPLGENAAGLREHLASALYLPVDSLELSTLLDISRIPELALAKNQQQFFLTLGAALRVEETVK